MVQTSDYVKLRIMSFFRRIFKISQVCFACWFCIFIIRMQTMRVQIIKRLHLSTNHSLFLNLFSLHSQHTAIATITHNDLLLMKAMKKEINLKLFVSTSGLKIVPTKAMMLRQNVSIKIEI